MAISDTLDDVKASIRELMKKRRYKKANLERQEAAELQSALAKCRGKLELCRKDFARGIRTQSRNIAEGQRSGMETVIHEQMMWDAAIGYMLVEDAIFALKSISTYDSIAHAYDMLEAATRQMAGKRSRPGRLTHTGHVKERDAYGYITSAAATQEKEELLNGFFERLKLTGDIAACLEEMKNPSARQEEMRSAYAGGAGPAAPEADLDAYMRRLDGAARESAAEEDFMAGASDLLDIHPPKGV